ncbi:LysR family transcriptional regulator [Aquabacterium sp. OR-4]|uniref:LysR family transcriptional regulator n=1 Tax=Aquabacterium sp. OR-4 TaxID=2978127 RepID=UPI0028CAF3B6|nr:LysR substrate-binding domain-containing protein [Aquabacterium sp. OR-4]MDT7836776.1 LysR substrate-binding domain-containing protein [Aquabacterium sp. OR-4]
MRLRHIEVFHAVMRAGTVSGAAHLLHISQPAVTKVLQHAEAQLGLLLFERVRGKFYPTPEALRLFTEVDKLHADLVAIRRLAVSLKNGEAQTVKLSVTPALGAAVVPAAMTRWSLAQPDGRCELSTQHTRELVNALLLGEAELGLALHDPKHPGIRAEPLASGRMMVLLPRKPARAGRRAGEAAGLPLAITELPSELIGLAGDDPLGLRLSQECEAQGVQLQFRITVQTYQLARALAEAGLGAAVVDPFTAASADRQRVVVRPLDPEMPVPLYLLTPSAMPLSQGARRLVRFLGEAAEACLAQADTVPA